jgi:DNA-binding MarR family transcriptional regulator
MSEVLGYLIADTGRLIRKSFDERARAIGITRAQWRLLGHLIRQPGLKQAPLAELLEVEPISLSRMVDRLQESGMVERRPDPQDRRAWCLYLTEKAEPVVQQLRTVSDALHQQALQGFEVSERLILESLLERIRANLFNNTTDTVERVAAHG